eukprot:5422804-Pyramimonas_sp.AAC.1
MPLPDGRCQPAYFCPRGGSSIPHWSNRGIYPRAGAEAAAKAESMREAQKAHAEAVADAEKAAAHAQKA